MRHKPFTSVHTAPPAQPARGKRRSGPVSADGSTAPLSPVSARHSTKQAVEAAAITLSDLGVAISAAREDERSRLARELHDELGAHLTAFRYAFARLTPRLPADDPQCAAVLDTAQQAFEALCGAGRRIIADLHPPAVESGLLPALASWRNQFQAFTGLPVSLACAADPRLTQLRPEAATALFRIAQEAVNNAAKHAGSPRIELRISTSKHYLRLCVTDYGRGFSAGARSRRSHFGIEGMRVRCKALDGALRISSKPGQPTQVSARLPWEAVLRTATNKDLPASTPCL